MQSELVKWPDCAPALVDRLNKQLLWRHTAVEDEGEPLRHDHMRPSKDPRARWSNAFLNSSLFSSFLLDFDIRHPTRAYESLM